MSVRSAGTGTARPSEHGNGIHGGGGAADDLEGGDSEEELPAAAGRAGASEIFEVLVVEELHAHRDEGQGVDRERDTLDAVGAEIADAVAAEQGDAAFVQPGGAGMVEAGDELAGVPEAA